MIPYDKFPWLYWKKYDLIWFKWSSGTYLCRKYSSACFSRKDINQLIRAFFLSKSSFTKTDNSQGNRTKNLTFFIPFYQFHSLSNIQILFEVLKKIDSCFFLLKKYCVLKVPVSWIYCEFWVFIDFTIKWLKIPAYTWW